MLHQEALFYFKNIESMIQQLCRQQSDMLEYLKGNQASTTFENGTEITHSPSPITNRATLTVDELKETLGISRTEAYALVKQDDFPSFRIGKKILISRQGLYQWISRQIEQKTERGAA